ncbi:MULTISPECIES: DUF6625 family protein [unclassified Enterococcus]|uniref:DUF6625 family protein n=1 Tax=unclassified Enterococcus TaxID=2608891 RepID=UPI001CE10EE9|nr:MULTISPECIES: DUF6625 family protein [unclassified Enterococcus]MCA5014098.1 hypothetical protein [Enterococcus sp. S23]MCA5017128.1 hypothetical protein [Enterococcus sp. S22(2020)]
MRSIILILVHFGELPNYFNLWLKSAEFNPTIDFLLVTDNSLEEYTFPKNVQIINSSMVEIQSEIQNVTNQKVSIKYPYKLVEYRPLFGELFQSLIGGHDFWGYIDSDVILGDVRKFLTDELLDQYDRLLTRGHFTLFRNTKYMNTVYKIEHEYKDCFNFNDVMRFDSVCAYDEWGWDFGYGLSEILSRKGIVSYDQIIFADINPAIYYFDLVNHDFGNAEYFIFNNGKLVAHREKQEKEFMYIHLQKRQLSNFVGEEAHYYIYPDRFSVAKETTETLEEQEKLFYSRKKKRRIKTILTKIKSDYLLMRLTMLFRRVSK